MGKKIIIKESQLKTIVKDIVLEAAPSDNLLFRGKKITLYKDIEQKLDVATIEANTNTSKADIERAGYMDIDSYVNVYLDNKENEQRVRVPRQTLRKVCNVPGFKFYSEKVKNKDIVVVEKHNGTFVYCSALDEEIDRLKLCSNVGASSVTPKGKEKEQQTRKHLYKTPKSDF